MAGPLADIRVLDIAAFACFDDHLAIPDIYADDFHATVRENIRAVKLDPMVCASTLGHATSRLGVSVIYSTTY